LIREITRSVSKATEEFAFSRGVSIFCQTKG
jgi:hypothetical protein